MPDEVVRYCYSGSLSQKWNAWKKALDLFAQKTINNKALISHTLSLSDWKEGFEIQEEKMGIKVVLFPEDG